LPEAIDDMPSVAADLHELSEFAREFGVRVGFEALAWGRDINDYRQAWEAVRHADHEHVGLILDSFHMLARRLPVDDIGQSPAQRIVLVQTADAPGIEMDLLFLSRHYRCFPGQGDLPVAAMMRKLDEIDYQGPISHEIFSDDFRASSTRRVASDGMRSFLWLDEQVGGRAAAALPAIDGVEFIEFVDDPNQVGVHTLQPIPRRLAETKGRSTLPHQADDDARAGRGGRGGWRAPHQRRDVVPWAQEAERIGVPAPHHGGGPG
jgi:4-hydroxyphenylpyruvate dioxygenase